MEISETMKKKQFRPYHIDIRELSIYVNDYCSKKCKHCYYIKDGKGHSDVNPEWIKWLTEGFKIQRAVLVGGEPLLSPILPKIIKILKSKNVAITISTNCDWVNWGMKKGKKTLPNGPRDMIWKDALLLFKTVDSVQISIEGDKQNTDEIRGHGSFDNSMVAVDLLKKDKVDVFFRATYSHSNYDIIPKMVKLSQEKDVHLVLFPYKGHDAIPLDGWQQEDLYNLLMKYTSEDGSRMGSVNIPQYYTYIGLHGYCPAGRNIINILPDGMITPCEMSMPPDHFILGKFEKHINNGDDWLDKEQLLSRCSFFLERIKQVDIDCMTCKYHRVCRSGCQETVEYMNCPLKYQIDYSSYSKEMGISRDQTRRKISKLKTVMNRRKGC